MPILLGVDTGGTYTDAVLYDDARPEAPVIAKAKALTTYQDLSIGIGGAVRAALAEGAATPGEIALASLSTTLATNALVEGRGGRVCLVFIGFQESDVRRAGLAQALGDDPVILIAGGHGADGAQAAMLDLDRLAREITALSGLVEAVAIVSKFGVRNPEHELAAKRLIKNVSALPATCGHELAANLNGPKRALTCVLNARLIGVIAELIAATERILAQERVRAPLMLVRGDGSLASVDFAKARPIETILSGPAASLVGAAALTGGREAVVSDIGGTTTDIAVLRDGAPALSAAGAVVGGHETMVEAVKMFTHGLGGDSEIRLDDASFSPRLMVGPRRVLPLCRLAVEHPKLVRDTLERQRAAPATRELDARFALRRNAGGARLGGLSEGARELFTRLADGPRPVDALIMRRRDVSMLDRLVARGLVMLSGFTPTDAAHVLGDFLVWDAETARAAAALLARQQDRRGEPVADSGEAFALICLRTLARRSAEALLSATLRHDQIAGVDPAADRLIAAALNGHSGVTALRIGVSAPIIGLGASAALHYPRIAALLGAEAAVPEHADVANAIGAVAGRVEIRREIEISQPTSGRFRVHTPDGPKDFNTLEAARDHGEAALREWVTQAAAGAGAAQIEIGIEFDAKTARIEGATMFVSGALRARAVGRPQLRQGAREAL